jgi:outer membrane protein
MRLAAAALLVALAVPSRAADAPLTLDDVLALAARANAELLVARADVDVARADRTAAFSNVLPRLDLSTALGRTFQGATASRSVLFGNIPQIIPAQESSNDPSYTLGLQLSQTVFDWQRFQEIDRASWNAQAFALQYDETALRIAFEVTARFYDVVKAERSLRVLEATAARSQELVERADALFAAGRGAKADTYTARVNLTNDRINVERQRTVLAEARTTLGQILGRTTGEGLALVPPAALDAPGLPSGEPPPVDALLARARERRPALAAQRALIEAAYAAVEGAQAGYLPALTAQAGYSRSAQELFGDEGAYADPTRAYNASAQLVLSWNLFEGFRTRSDVQRARSTLERARATSGATGQNVAKEIADARLRVESLQRQVALSAESLATAREALSLATQRFEAGLASQLEVRDASLKITQAELSLVETRIDHAVAVSDLSRAVGGAL